ncbi:MAG: hypothetical protein NTW27_00095, partial [Deltaproteobacteria bacterium]|nr:hypothetical protein [Deltaproteobacteria bacterium]
IWYFFVHLGVPPSPMFLSKTGSRGTPSFSRIISSLRRQTMQKGRNYSINRSFDSIQAESFCLSEKRLNNFFLPEGVDKTPEYWHSLI